MEKYVFSSLDALFRLAEFVVSRLSASTNTPQPEVHVERITFSAADCAEEVI